MTTKKPDLYREPPPPHSYVLDGHTPRRPKSLGEWADFYEDIGKRILARDRIEGVTIVTAFLTIDDDFGFTLEPPRLFGTMVFGREWEEQRCETYDEAIEQHRRVVSQIGAVLD